MEVPIPVAFHIAMIAGGMPTPADASHLQHLPTFLAQRCHIDLINEDILECAMTDQDRGDWARCSMSLTPEARQIFETATAGFLSVKYTPCAFATQNHAGTRYTFLCEAQPASDVDAVSVVKIRVFQPLCNPEAPIAVKPILVSIETITP